MIELNDGGVGPKPFDDGISKDEAVLEHYARAIAGKAELDKGMRFGKHAYSYERTVAYLARRVEELTEGKRTVLNAASYLFNIEVFGPCLHLASCAFDTPAGRELTDLTDDTVLIILTDSLMMPVEPAPADWIAKQKRGRDEHDEWHRDREAIQEQVKEQIGAIRTALAKRIRESVDEQDTWTLGALLGEAGRDLEGILTACQRIGVGLDEIIREARG